MNHYEIQDLGASLSVGGKLYEGGNRNLASASLPVWPLAEDRAAAIHPLTRGGSAGQSNFGLQGCWSARWDFIGIWTETEFISSICLRWSSPGFNLSFPEGLDGLVGDWGSADMSWSLNDSSQLMS